MVRLAKEVEEGIGFIETEIDWAEQRSDLPTLIELRKELYRLEWLAVDAIQSVRENSPKA